MTNEEEKVLSVEETKVEDGLNDEKAKEIAVVFGENSNGESNKNKDKKKNERKPTKRPERMRQEYDNKIISVRRVTRVVSGGRRFSFSIAVIVGDKKGKVGVGIGKAGDTPIAIEKAMRDAKKNMITVSMTKGGSIAHPVEAKYSSATVSVMPAPGKGVIAGSATRIILELAGVKEVASKILSRSKNKLNIARATIKALSKLKSRKAHVNK